jgi:hypothetical protein
MKGKKHEDPIPDRRGGRLSRRLESDEAGLWQDPHEPVGSLCVRIEVKEPA